VKEVDSSRPSIMSLSFLRPFSRCTLPIRVAPIIRRTPIPPVLLALRQSFSTTPPTRATLNQVLRGCRKPRRARKGVSPAVKAHSQLKGVCLRVAKVKPKKPNSAKRSTARIRLSSGKIVDAYIPGEGHNVQQHSIVLIRGGRSQDCPGVRYHCVRGAFDLV
jgi:small subunit ribosomal protein S12